MFIEINLDLFLFWKVSETSDELKALEQLTGVPILSTAPEKISTEDQVAESQKTCPETFKNTIIKEKVPEKTFSSIGLVLKFVRNYISVNKCNKIIHSR